MTVTIHQPEHLPWLGFFNKMAKADKYVFLDSVQFEKNYFQNRNRIIGTNGVQWIGIPVYTQGHITGSIAETQIASGKQPKWKEKYINTIKMSYGGHPFYKEVFPVFEKAMNIDTEYLCEINISVITAFAEKLNIKPAFIRSSEINAEGSKSDLILDICRLTGADLYIAGPSGREYLDIPSFSRAGIKVKFDDYRHPVYPQKRTDVFIPYLSSLDLFMNCGFEESIKIITAGNEGLSDI